MTDHNSDIHLLQYSHPVVFWLHLVAPCSGMFGQLLTQAVTLESSPVSSLVWLTKDSLVNGLFAQDAEKSSLRSFKKSLPVYICVCAGPCVQLKRKLTSTRETATINALKTPEKLNPCSSWERRGVKIGGPSFWLKLAQPLVILRHYEKTSSRAAGRWNFQTLSTIWNRERDAQNEANFVSACKLGLSILIVEQNYLYDTFHKPPKHLVQEINKFEQIMFWQ